jgi:hypothetical protein
MIFNTIFVNILQKNIEKIMKRFEVKIRYNSKHILDELAPKWRVIFGDVEYQVDEVEIHGKCFTSEDIVKGDDGNQVRKYHLSTKAKTISFVNNKNIQKAILK